MMLTLLRTFIHWLKSPRPYTWEDEMYTVLIFGKADEPAEEFPPVSNPVETPWHITMPGKYRPYILQSFPNEQDALLALEMEAAALSAAGWFVYRVYDGLWRISLDGELNTQLEVLSTVEAVKS